MKQTILRITNTAFALLITTSVMTASNKTMPKFVQEYMWQIEHVEKQLTSLESAIPQEKYMWRPAEDVRSFSEVYLHAAFGNYLFIKTLGAKLNNDFNFVFTEAKKWDSQTTDKKEVETIVKKSFENLKDAVKSLNEKDLEKEVEFFGNKTSVRNILMSALSHLHEHLGQSIAYARMNGITPPWSEKK